MQISENSRLKVGLLGASFDTGNMGVSALAESSVKIILQKWPNAEVTLLGSGYTPREYNLSLLNRRICLGTVPIRFSKNILLSYHFLWFALYGLLVKILPDRSLMESLVNRNRYFQKLYNLDIVVDITAGDSFSDIYGTRRFVWVFLQKWLVLFLGKKLVFLPQTYGPFKRRITRLLAKYVLNRAHLIYSRDMDDLEYIKGLLSNHNKDAKVRFAPDVAFVLDSHTPAHIDVGSLPAVRNKSSILIGINISGLLFHGGYNRNNMFELRTNYAQLVFEIIELLLKDGKTLVLLIPHVFPQAEFEVESDPDACMKVYEQLGKKYPDRIFLAQGKYTHNEIKHIIGLCDFFIGSRMHSCIAALSQMIPTIGIAYSKKFSGVFASIGIGDLVIELRYETEGPILSQIQKAFSNRKAISEKLSRKIPQIKQDVLHTLDPVLSKLP